MPLWIPSPFYMSRNGFKPRYIIIHGTAGGSSAQAVAEWFQDNRAQASTHYIIGKDGTVVQCVSEDQAAWGNGAITTDADNWWNHNPNVSTISIEHVKSRTDNDEPLTEAQALASFKLVNEICERWGIPKRYATADGGITGHFSIDPVNTSGCPGLIPGIIFGRTSKQRNKLCYNFPLLTSPNEKKTNDGFVNRSLFLLVNNMQ